MALDDVKCCFLVYGLPRSLRWTKNSILKNVIEPFKGVSTIKTFIHFNMPEYISNPRSNEFQIPLTYPDISGLNPNSMLIESQNYSNIEEKLDSFKDHDLQSLDNIQSHINLLQAFRSLKRIWSLAEFSGAGDSDVFIFIRPDLEYIDRWPATDLIDAVVNRNVDLICPAWGDWGGLNDRMAVASRRGALTYVSRWDILETLVAEGEPRNSEKLLMRAAEIDGLRQESFSSRALRVRADGRTQKEGFEFPVRRRALWKFRRIWAQMTM